MIRQQTGMNPDASIWDVGVWLNQEPTPLPGLSRNWRHKAWSRWVRLQHMPVTVVTVGRSS